MDIFIIINLIFQSINFILRVIKLRAKNVCIDLRCINDTKKVKSQINLQVN